jgi:hypothetical protein
MTNPILIKKKNYLRAILLVPVMCVVAFTGCSSISGTAANRTATTDRATAYLENKQENANIQPADSDPDPTYEWFY